MRVSDRADEPFFREWSERSSVARRSLARAEGIALRAGALPQRTPIATVVGSKGKGTAAIAAASVLSHAGLRTGLLTSPSYRSNCERIRVDGHAITEPDLASLGRELATHLSASTPASGEYLSPSGAFTVMGLAHFQRSGCDAAVVEEGLGGRSDEVSMFAPDVVGVTEIFREHLDLLGGSLTSIAEDLLGVVRPTSSHIVSLTQERPVEDVIRSVAAATGCELTWLERCAEDASMSDLMAKNLELGAVVGRTFAGHLGRPVSDNDAQRAAHSIEHPGRLTYFEPAPGSHWLVDSAVSGAAASGALRDFTTAHGRPDLVLVCLPDDKDITGTLEATEGHERMYVDLPGSHLSFSPTSWPDTLVPFDEAIARARSESTSVVALGTISFVGRVLTEFDLPTSTVYELDDVRP